jgi:hypothetical protein
MKQVLETLPKVSIDFIRKKLLGRVSGTVSGTLSWTSGDSLAFNLNLDTMQLHLHCTRTIIATQVKEQVNQTVQIVRVRSNLGKGYNWYFICGRTGKRCKHLYSAYNCKYYFSKHAYNGQLYHYLQTVTKTDRANSSYHALNATHTAVLARATNKTTYMGKPTKLQKRLQGMRVKLENLDNIRLGKFIISISKLSKGRIC